MEHMSGLHGLFEALDGVDAYRELRSRLAAHAPQTARATMLEAAKPYVIAALWKHGERPLLVVCPRPEDARQLIERIEAYCGDDAPIYHFAESEVSPYERLALDTATLHSRIAALGSLRPAHAAQPPLVVASAMALMQRTLGAEALDAQRERLVVGQRLALDATLERWARMGYAHVPAVEAPGQMARRGGIVDVFSPGMALPARIDLWGDEIDSLRHFDPATQRSTGAVDGIAVLPAWEVLPSLAGDEVGEMLRGLDYANVKTSERDRIQDEMAQLLAHMTTDAAAFYAGFFHRHTLLDHLETSSALVIVDEPSETEEAAHQWEAAAARLRLTKQERGELPLGFPPPFADWPSIAQELERFAVLEVSRYHKGRSGGATALPFAAPPLYHSDLGALAAAIGAPRAPTVLATQHSRRLDEVLREGDVGTRESRDLPALPDASVVHVVHAPIAGGWTLREREDAGADLLRLLTDAEIFGAAKRRPGRSRRRTAPARHVLIDELAPGQLVVHVDHGIGRFAGTRAMDEGDARREYLVLEYAERDRLYVPMEQVGRISLYSGGSEEAPSLTRLGTQEWSRAVARAKESTKQLAFDLLALYAGRELADGHPAAPDTPWQREMEDAFPYVETPDQAEAIGAVKDDMEAPRPMDRLVCGDVGYGKTEVALRASFKTVMDGKQVAVLVPTTVLAQQHFQTFAERLGPYPIRVEMLSRFRTPAEQSDVIRRLRLGEVDVVVGTHRLVQRDVGFKDLGLLVIDEEHRFGVNQKEQLREMRHGVDVLTLTATPIPRTLHMALAGVRDISNIETPPEERLPIKTYLAEASDELVREAVQRELDRGGQVYFLHNRVKTIDLAVGRLRELVPAARLLVAHGRMNETVLADVMERFIDGEADVLVCTTIIESGLDIPTVNTLIVDRADRFGLAQLYQLRGRIGRRAQRGYAYLLIPPGRRLTEAAQRRLQTIAAATELGAGFRIAMRDLEIRGAGNILGAEQSGHIHAVGFDLYTRMLQEAVADLRAQGGMPEQRHQVDPQVDLGLEANIPDWLVDHLPTRMGLYQRMARARSIGDVEDIIAEFRDRFGSRLPDEVYALLYTLRVSVLAREADVESVLRQANEVTMRLREPAGGARLALERALGRGVRVGHQQVHLPTQSDAPWGQALLEVLEGLERFQRAAADLAEAAAIR